MEADARLIRQFFERLHGPEPSGWLIVWTRQDKATRAFELAREGELERAVEYCRERAAEADVYAAVGLQAARPAKGRGSEQGVRSIPALWADIDIGGAAHKAKNLPASEEEAFTLIGAAGLPPSITVRSGFGLQLYWRFKEPWLLETESDRLAAKSMSVRFQTLLRQEALTRGWNLDSTADLCRVLRVPGTFNRKVPRDIRPVTAEYSERAYTLDDLETVLEGVEDPGSPAPKPAPPADLPPARLPPILEGCAWMRHCRDDAATLPEPEWYRMLTVVARCEDAERWAHELGKPYPKYTRRETQQKLKQASGEKIAPVTCAYIESDLGGERFCSQCLFRGNVNSPIAIGRLTAADGEDLTEAPRSADIADAQDPPPSPVQQSAVTAATKIEKFTELGNARRFVARYRGRILYCERWGRWFLWDGRRWMEDQKLEIYALAVEMIRDLYAIANKLQDPDEKKAFLKHILRSESHRAITAMINLAKADRSVAVHPDQFDTNPWLLTVHNGTLDLRTGQLRRHDPRDLVTKLAPVTYDPEVPCPRWMEFLYLVMNQRSSLVAFLQRAFGASLTGITSDKALYILYGAGGDNGKSTMVDVFQSLLGDYALRTPIETLLRKKEGAIPNDVARLKGARFVWSSESDRGARLSESLIKDVTGGDKLSARFMRGEFFEFFPEFKLWLATNHKPTVRGDPAIWRRLKLIPFDISIPLEQQRPRHEVMTMFRGEFSGILNWALKGCADWRDDGLNVPDEVVIATREYEAEQDTFAMFLEERCVCVPNARAASASLYHAYREWAEKYGESPMSHKTFAQLMSERGYRKQRTSRGVLYEGVGLRLEEVYDTPRGKDQPGNRGVPGRSAAAGDDEGEVV